MTGVQTCALPIYVAVKVGAGLLSTVTEAVLIHPLASLTVTVYDPGERLVNTPEAWKVLPLILYCKAPKPPVPNTVMLPLLLPQVAEEGIAVSKGVAPLNMVISTVFTQPVASLTRIE